MYIQQIRNATLKVRYGKIMFLIDPWLQDKGTGFSAQTIKSEMSGIKSPLNDLPISIGEILKDVDYCLVTHIHPDHFTADYLPKDINIIVQNKEDLKKAKVLGFENVFAFEKEQMVLDDVTIIKTPAIHGDNKQIADIMGEVSGYIFEGEEKKLYIAGDTIFYEGVENTLKKYTPEVIVLNCCEAILPFGRLIMNLDDIDKVCELSPNSKVIASHLDSVNHALLTSDDVRVFAKNKGLQQLLIPDNGEVIEV